MRTNTPFERVLKGSLADFKFVNWWIHGFIFLMSRTGYTIYQCGSNWENIGKVSNLLLPERITI